MRKYPLPLNSGKECIILEGFGDKICKLIDERLKNFLEEGGVLHEDDSYMVIDDENPNPLIGKKSTANKKTTKDFHDNQNEEEEDIGSLDFISHSKTSNSNRPLLSLNSKKKSTSSKKKNIDGEDSDESQSTSSQAIAKKTNTTRGKEYIPSFRSGPYAILVALHENQKIDV